MEDFSLYIQRAGEDTAKGTVEEWYCGVTDACAAVDGGFKDFASKSWQGEDGEDVYIPATPRLAAYDAEWELCYKGPGRAAFATLEAMRSWLSGKLLALYDPYTGMGRRGAWLKGFSSPKYTRRKGAEVLRFTLTFRITAPGGGVTATEEGGEVKLTENS